MPLAHSAALLALLCLSHCATGARIHKSAQEGGSGTSVHLFSREHIDEPKDVEECRKLITKGQIAQCMCGAANNKGLSGLALVDACAELKAETQKVATNWECAVEVSAAGQSTCVRVDNEKGDSAVDDGEAPSVETKEPVAVADFRSAGLNDCSGRGLERANCVCDLANGKGVDVAARCKNRGLMFGMMRAIPYQCSMQHGRCKPAYPFRRGAASKPIDVIGEGAKTIVDDKVDDEDRQVETKMQDEQDPKQNEDFLEELDLEEEEIATDCEGSWQEWGECSKPCGRGEQSRTYTVTIKAAGGTECPASPETQECNAQACAINCAGSWGTWEDCSNPCGGGSQTRSYDVTTVEDHGGEACPAPETKKCNENACPVDCAGSMGSWSACSAKCGGGTQSRAFTTSTPPAHGGDPCPASESRSCNENECPVDCDGSWGAWDSCSEQCGGGSQSRSFTVNKDSDHGGQACPASPESKDCNENACPVACEGSWGAWGSCEKDCGGGTQTRTWSTSTAAEHGGAGCPTSPASRSCNTHACRVNCASTWSAWGACDKPCGDGTRKKTTIVQTPASHGGTACPASPVTESCNRGECHVDCKGWMGGWSSCSKGCGGGQKTQMYHMTVAPKAGGKACPIAGGTVSCNAHACPVHCDYGYGKWTKCSAHCNGGTQSRSVNVRVPAKHGGRACPAGESRNCNTHQCACTGRQTPWNDDGGGNAVYFDRHHAYCDNQKMSMWRLTRHGGHRHIKFSYTCCDTPKNDGSSRWVYTNYNDDGDGETVYFDRHDLGCNYGEAMASWQLQRGSGSNGWGARRRTMRFKYRCSDIRSETSSQCSSYSTYLNSDGNGNSVYLDRHNLQCPRNHKTGQFPTVMKRWHLNRMGTHNRIRFDYTCCR